MTQVDTVARTSGRTFAALLLVQSVVGYTVNFVLLGAAVAPPGFLTNAAANAFQVNLAALLTFVSGALWLAMAITVRPVFRQYSKTLALLLIALSVVSFAGLIAEGVAIRSMAALSLEYARAGDANAALFQPLAAVVRSVRNSAHFMNFLAGGSSLIVIYAVLFRFSLIPRLLSAFGLATVVLMISGAIIPLLGYPTVMLMFMPMGLSHLALASWLLIKGFGEPHRPSSATLAAELR